MEIFDKHRDAALSLFANKLLLQRVAANDFKCPARSPGFIRRLGWDFIGQESGEKFGPANEIISPAEISVGGKKFW